MTTPKIACPSCSGYRSKVVNSRGGESRDGVWRRRKCLDCGQKFSTEEKLLPPRQNQQHHNI